MANNIENFMAYIQDIKPFRTKIKDTIQKHVFHEQILVSIIDTLPSSPSEPTPIENIEYNGTDQSQSSISDVLEIVEYPYGSFANIGYSTSNNVFLHYLWDQGYMHVYHRPQAGPTSTLSYRVSYIRPSVVKPTVEVWNGGTKMFTLDSSRVTQAVSGENVWEFDLTTYDGTVTLGVTPPQIPSPFKLVLS